MINLNELSIVYVIYNDFETLKKTIYSTINANPLEILIIDNSPIANDITLLPKSEKIKYYHTQKNLGYAGGSNYGFKSISQNSKWLTIMNADAFFEADYFEKINDELSECSFNHSIGSIGSKLIKFDFEKMVKTKVVDSAGIKIFPNGRAIDRGQNEIDKGQYNNNEIIDGICGALVTYNVDIIKEVNKGTFIFDERFHAYKEDIDIALAIEKNGYKSFYIGNVTAYHGRGMGSIKKWPLRNYLKKMREQSPYLKILSRSNHWFMIFKHKNYIFKNKLSILKVFSRTIIEILFMLFFDLKVLVKSIARFYRLVKTQIK